MWASRAHGACGDYLTIGSDHFAMPGAGGAEQFPNPTHVENPLPTEPARTPCPGPGCSSDKMPITTLQVVERVQHNRTWACLAQGQGVLEPSPHWATQPQGALAIQDFSFRILRPPRPILLDRSARDKVA